MPRHGDWTCARAPGARRPALQMPWQRRTGRSPPRENYLPKKIPELKSPLKDQARICDNSEMAVLVDLVFIMKMAVYKLWSRPTLLVRRPNNVLRFVHGWIVSQLSTLKELNKEAEKLTQDVMRDLHTMKLDIGNYAVSSNSPILHWMHYSFGISKLTG